MKALSLICVVAAAVLLLGGGVASGQQSWTKHEGNPVMSGSGSGAWDLQIFDGVVVFNSDSNRYEMWYAGSRGWVNGSYNPLKIGFAWSQDGLSWTKYSGNPVMSPTSGAWDGTSLELGSVLRENGEYKMWYYGIGGTDRQIGYATSPDGIQWTKHAEPVLSAYGTGWESRGVLWCSVLPSPAGYTMYYSGADDSAKYRVGRAISPDGINWIRDSVNNPVLTVGASGTWDDEGATSPICLEMGGELFMWYTGWAKSFVGTAIGMATSTDGGASWVKWPDNPVINRGPAGSWDQDRAEACAAWFVNDYFHLLYQGFRDNTALWKFGLATSPVVAAGPEQSVPSQFALSQNYPNPFNPSTTIRYTLPERSHVTLAVFNPLGQQVATLVEGEMEAGHHEVTFDASSLASGVYLYRLTAGEYAQTRALILLR